MTYMPGNQTSLTRQNIIASPCLCSMDVVTNGLHHNVWKNISVKKSDENKSDTDDLF